MVDLGLDLALIGEGVVGGDEPGLVLGLGLGLGFEGLGNWVWLGNEGDNWGLGLGEEEAALEKKEVIWCCLLTKGDLPLVTLREGAIVEGYTVREEEGEEELEGEYGGKQEEEKGIMKKNGGNFTGIYRRERI